MTYVTENKGMWGIADNKGTAQENVSQQKKSIA